MDTDLIPDDLDDDLWADVPEPPQYAVRVTAPGRMHAIYGPFADAQLAETQAQVWRAQPDELPPAATLAVERWTESMWDDPGHELPGPFLCTPATKQAVWNAAHYYRQTLIAALLFVLAYLAAGPAGTPVAGGLFLGVGIGLAWHPLTDLARLGWRVRRSN